MKALLSGITGVIVAMTGSTQSAQRKNDATSHRPAMQRRRAVSETVLPDLCARSDVRGWPHSDPSPGTVLADRTRETQCQIARSCHPADFSSTYCSCASYSSAQWLHSHAAQHWSLAELSAPTPSITHPWCLAGYSVCCRSMMMHCYAKFGAWSGAGDQVILQCLCRLSGCQNM